MPDYAYKPRHGYDIRVRPPREDIEEQPAWAGAHTRLCDAPGCPRKSAVRVAKSPRDLHQKLWLCAEHARAHNLQWNYFDGLSEREAEAARHAGFYGDRPTWSMGRNDRARAWARSRGPADFADALGLFRDAVRNPAADAGPMRDGRRLPRLQTQAFERLGLPVTAPAAEIRRRYAELVRRFHPDANGGDRGAESQLAEVVKAHQILKKARLC